MESKNSKFCDEDKYCEKQDFSTTRENRTEKGEIRIRSEHLKVAEYFKYLDNTM